MSEETESREQEGDEQPPFAPALSESQRSQVERRAAIGATVVHEAIRRQGEGELERPASSLFWSGLAGGLSMGFSLVAQGLLRRYLPETEWRPLIERFGYCRGFLIVILGRQQLFTESTLTSVIPLLARRDLGTLARVGRLWGIVLLANLAGAAIFAVIVARTDVFPPEVRAAFASLSQDARAGSDAVIAIRAVFAGWLIALMVWMIPGSESGKTLIIILVTYLVGLAALAHVIAGSVEVLYLVAAGDLSPGGYLAYFLPTLGGNIVGGVLLVASLNHAQVVAERLSAREAN